VICARGGQNHKKKKGEEKKSSYLSKVGIPHLLVYLEMGRLSLPSLPHTKKHGEK
jgi:hypothetical protein